MTSPPRARPTEVVETLRAMRELLSVPERWTKGANARDVHGYPVVVEANPERAICFCLIGAAGYTEKKRGEFHAAMDALDKLTFPAPAAIWNDAPKRTHAEVLALLDRAIAQAEGT